MFDDSDQDKLNTLKARIGKAEQAADPEKKANKGESGPMGRSAFGAVRLGSDFVALIMGTAFFGWLVDRQLGTAPWLMLVLIVIGFGGGFWMLIRVLVNKANEEDQKADGPKVDDGTKE